MRSISARKDDGRTLKSLPELFRAPQSIILCPGVSTTLTRFFALGVNDVGALVVVGGGINEIELVEGRGVGRDNGGGINVGSVNIRGIPGDSLVVFVLPEATLVRWILSRLGNAGASSSSSSASSTSISGGGDILSSAGGGCDVLRPKDGERNDNQLPR